MNITRFVMKKRIICTIIGQHQYQEDDSLSVPLPLESGEITYIDVVMSGYFDRFTMTDDPRLPHKFYNGGIMRTIFVFPSELVEEKVNWSVLDNLDEY